MPDHIITATDTLYRRFPILNEPSFIPFWKIENGIKVPTSAAFKTKPGEDGLSVDIAVLTTPAISIGDSAKFNIASFLAAVPLNEGLKCVQDIQPDNEAHALILGNTKSLAKKMQKASTVI